jgi:hypothetical protein
MQILVLIEPLAGNGFRATAGEPFAMSAEGMTGEEALNCLRELMQDRLKTGASIASLEVPPPNPWLAGRGMFRDDPMFDKWQEAIREYRRKVDEEQGMP